MKEQFNKVNVATVKYNQLWLNMYILQKSGKENVNVLKTKSNKKCMICVLNQWTKKTSLFF